MDMIVIKYFEKIPGITQAHPQWAKVSVSDNRRKYNTAIRPRFKRIKRDEAMRLIAENGLTEVFRDPKLGVVFDTPSQDFKRWESRLFIPYDLGA